MSNGKRNTHFYFTSFCFLLLFQLGYGQAPNKAIVGKWQIQKHLYDKDTTNRNPPGISRSYTFLNNGTYERVLIRNDKVKGVFVETGNWKLIKNETVVVFSKRKEKNSPRLRDLEIKIVHVSKDRLELKEMGVSGEEGVFGVSYYTRIK